MPFTTALGADETLVNLESCTNIYTSGFCTQYPAPETNWTRIAYPGLDTNAEKFAEAFAYKAMSGAVMPPADNFFFYCIYLGFYMDDLWTNGHP